MSIPFPPLSFVLCCVQQPHHSLSKWGRNREDLSTERGRVKTRRFEPAVVGINQFNDEVILIEVPAKSGSGVDLGKNHVHVSGNDRVGKKS